MLSGLTGLLFQPCAASSAEIIEESLAPEVIQIGIFYNGKQLTVSGEVPADSEAVVRVTGKRQDLELKKKGRVLGLFWMNRETVTFRHVPYVYLLCTSAEFDHGMQSAPAQAVQAEIGLESLQRQVQIVAADAEKDMLFQELLKLKKSEDLYAVHHDAVRYGDAQGPLKSFKAFIWLPPRLHPGKYGVEVVAFKEGKILATASEELLVDEVGLPALLARLAFENGALYGVLASLLAIFAGLLMSFFFKGSKGAH